MGKYYVVFYNDRCMGFATDQGKAVDLVRVFGEGSDYEAVEGTFPADETRGAAEHNARRASLAKIVPLRPRHDSEVSTIELLQAELASLAGALGVSAEITADDVDDGLSDDPWAEQTQVIGPLPGESGFFASKAG